MEQENTTSWWRKAIQSGVIGGIIAILAGLIGMIESFHARDIIAGRISMGETLLLLIVIGFAYSSSRNEQLPISTRVTSGVITGVVTSLMIVLFLMLGAAVNLRSIFVNASPALYKILTLEIANTSLAYIAIIVIGAVVSLAASLVHAATPFWKRIISSGFAIVLLLALLQDLIRISLTPFPFITSVLSWMFGRRGQEGLSILGAIVVFLIVAGAIYNDAKNGAARRARREALPEAAKRTRRWVNWGLLGVFLLIWPQIAGPVLSDVTNSVGLYILMGLGLNIVVGYAGLLDLGYVAFYALGAFTMGVLTTTGGEIFFDVRWTFWEALPFAVIVAVLAGIMLGIPVLKIRGDYLAIITLGFGEIIRIMFLSDFLKPYFGGSFGIVSIASPTIGGIVLDSPQTLYYVILAACFVALFVAHRLRDSRIGRAWKAIREDEDVAQAMGINLTATKLLAFATGAAFGGLSGAIFAAKLST
ncbi:MAG TPA: hypothetical protein PLA27_16600, partial [Anaerolineales bacterium]|nr:hypothetical protein [Anaerolineales bacterium]